MLAYYQHLPERIDPIFFEIGSFSVHWYSLMYLLAFVVVYVLLRWRVAHDNKDLKFSIFIRQPADQFSNKVSITNTQIFNFIFDWMIYAIAGLLVGARLGHVLFYNFGYYFQNPLAIISPHDPSSGLWTGILGMSYFGGAIGVVLASWLFARRRKINFWIWGDWVIPAIPAGYFFGRIGNFLNGELYGKITEKPWGMYFNSDFEKVLRHPTQLYEAFFEGAVLFAVLWHWRNKAKFPGSLVLLYLLGYGLFRLGIEFWRQSEAGAEAYFGLLSLSQLFSLGFVIGALLLWIILSKKKEAV